MKKPVKTLLSTSQSKENIVVLGIKIKLKNYEKKHF